MPIDYETLRVIWWVLLGLLLIGFAITDGFDLGIGILLHRVARTDNERRVVLNSIGPIWEGNQVWLILGAGAIFAAWPEIYAVSFSGFYFAMLMVLFSLILRPVGFKYRSKLSNPNWRAAWDLGIFIAGFIPALIFGVAVGNVLQGVPFHYDNNLQSYYTGTLIELLNPFALLCGLTSVAMLIMHGGIFLSIKTEGNIQQRATKYSHIGAIITVILFIVGGIWIAKLNGYVLTNAVAADGPSNPLHKTVALQVGAWLTNYKTYPWMMLAPILGITGALLAIIFSFSRYLKTAWLMSATSVAAIITTCGMSMFPFILPSSTNPNMSLLVWDASSSQLTLFIMLLATCIFLPIIILYTSWVYYVLRGKVTDNTVQQNKSAY
jgi:cytochrome d ubiquinol oxidase subunit II